MLTHDGWFCKNKKKWKNRFTKSKVFLFLTERFKLGNVK